MKGNHRNLGGKGRADRRSPSQKQSEIAKPILRYYGPRCCVCPASRLPDFCLVLTRNTSPTSNYGLSYIPESGGIGLSRRVSLRNVL